MSDYRSLIVWQRAHRLTLRVYGISKAFPPDERYGLTSQLRRAMASVPANIAEGLGRDSNRETVRYCRIAQGSLNEVEYHFLLARDLGYIDAPEFRDAVDELSQIRRMLTKFIQSLPANHEIA
jgi:four helix bundle protein